MSDDFVILGDLHCGARNASLILCEYQLSFFENELFPYLKKHNIKTILQLGDIFDSRKFSNHIVLAQWKKRFFDVLEDDGVELIITIGNHDIASRNTLEVNAPSLFLSAYSNITIIGKVVERDICGVPFVLFPWICMENEKDVSTVLENTNALYAAGHFEFDGFEMQKGIPAHGGLNPKDFHNFDCVFSGHYHTRNKKNNIYYVGVPYEMTWADFDDQKGFVHFHVAKQTTTFVKTTASLFQRIEYNDKGTITPIPKNVANAYIKVVVINKTNPYEFDKFIDGITLQSPADLKIVDIGVDFDDVDIEDELEVEDTKTIISKFIEQIDTDLDKERVNNMMQSLYLSALEITE